MSYIDYSFLNCFDQLSWLWHGPCSQYIWFFRHYLRILFVTRINVTPTIYPDVDKFLYKNVIFLLVQNTYANVLINAMFVFFGKTFLLENAIVLSIICTQAIFPMAHHGGLIYFLFNQEAGHSIHCGELTWSLIFLFILIA